MTAKDVLLVARRGLDLAAGAYPRVVATMLAIAATLAVVMAVLAPINHRPDLWRGPPDEHGHRGAARYYMDNWLPPRVGDPATLESYSRDYGFSYVNDTDPVYPLAGKFAALASGFTGGPDLAVRLFNAMLLAILAAVCFVRPSAALPFTPLVLSPQVWYIFSYFNNDAFPVFVASLLAWQVADPGSGLNRFLDDARTRRHWWAALGFVALVALLALSKKNFLAVLALIPCLVALARFGTASAALLGVAALFGATAYQGWFALEKTFAGASAAAALVAVGAAIFGPVATRRPRAKTLLRLGLLGALAVALVLPRFVWDAAVHGSLEQKRLALGVLQQQIAKPEYKPSTIYYDKERSYYGIELRARGTPLSELFSPKWQWHSRTFATGTGSYGWIQFTAETWYYAAMLGLYLAILAIYAFAVWRTAGAAAWTGFGLVAAFSALTVSIALFHSWNNDFQAQGRYLFPIIAILGAGLTLVRERIPWRALLVAVAACFALGLYSFIFIGLRWVPGSF